MRYLFKSSLAILVPFFEDTHSGLFHSFKLDGVSLIDFLGLKYISIFWILIS